MNKKYLLVLAIIFIVIGVMGTGAYSCGIQEISDGNYQAEDRIILSTGIGEDEGENVSQPEVKIIIEEIDNGSEKQLHYDILVDFKT